MVVEACQLGMFKFDVLVKGAFRAIGLLAILDLATVVPMNFGGCSAYPLLLVIVLAG